MAEMNPSISLPADAKPHTVHAVTRHQIRDSSLLPAGRLMALGVNFVVQILIIRHLSKMEYGAFQYALLIAAFGNAFATFGMDQAITRLIPIYHERGKRSLYFAFEHSDLSEPNNLLLDQGHARGVDWELAKPNGYPRMILFPLLTRHRR
jgi:hypothetical protein